MTYSDVPIVEDLFCPETSFQSIREDAYLGGRNNWTISSAEQLDSGGWTMQIERNLLTKDKGFDEQLLKIPSKVFYALLRPEDPKYIPESFTEFLLVK